MSECKCELRMRQNEVLHIAITPNADALSDGKSLHTQSFCSVAQGIWREKKRLHGSPITFVIRIHRSHHVQLES